VVRDLKICVCEIARNMVQGCFFVANDDDDDDNDILFEGDSSKVILYTVKGSFIYVAYSVCDFPRYESG